MDEIRKSNFYAFFSIMGYFIGALNIYLFFILLFGIDFSLVIYFSFLFFILFLNFIFSSITYMYVDMQKETNIRGKIIFYIYGESAYITLFLLPFVYLKFFNILSGGGTLIVFLLCGFSIWLYRVIMIKKITGFNFFNAFIAIFFPHIFLFFSFLSLAFFAGFLTYAIIG